MENFGQIFISSGSIKYIGKFIAVAVSEASNKLVMSWVAIATFGRLGNMSQKE